MDATSTPPAPDDEVPVRRSDALVWDVAAARRKAGVTVPRWVVGLGLAGLVGLFVVGWAAPLGAVGLVLVGLAAEAVRRGLDSRAWPTVHAVTTAREIRESHVVEGGAGAGRATYTPVVRYEYVVDGETYPAVSLEDGQRSYASLDEARRAVRRDFPAGATVTVWYDPSDPLRHTRHGADVGRAVRHALGPGAIGLVFLAAGVFVWLR